MKFSSIFYTITFIFILATISIFLAFLWLIEYDKENYTRELNTKYSIVSRATLLKLNNLITEDEYKKQISNLQMPEISELQTKDKILKDGKILEEIVTDIGTTAIVEYQKRYFVKITHNETIYLLNDTEFQLYRYDIIKLIFLIVFLILLATYIFVISKIKPLRKLKRQIDKFAKGDLNITNTSTGIDEISDVAEAFYNAVTQIKALNHSRQLFLRNIMHELKTPITKGRITAEMIEKNKHQERLISVFERLESLINEFAAVERVTSGFEIDLSKNYRIKDIIDEAIDIAMVDNDAIKLKIHENLNINADFKLISIAIKNMIDNAIKYSDNKKVCIEIFKDKIEFINIGSPLDNPLSYYTEPFTQGKNAIKSFGLGLYIVHNILKSHKFKLGYRHDENKNIFEFVLS